MKEFRNVAVYRDAGFWSSRNNVPGPSRYEFRSISVYRRPSSAETMSAKLGRLLFDTERSTVTFAASSKTFQNRPTMLSRFAYLQLNIRPSTNFEDNCICGFRFIFVYLFVSDNWVHNRERTRKSTHKEQENYTNIIYIIHTLSTQQWNQRTVWNTLTRLLGPIGRS